MEVRKVTRRELSPERREQISRRIQDPALSLSARAALRLRLFLEEEDAVWMPDDPIPAWRTLISFPDIYADGEKERLSAGHWVHEQGRVCNISSDWAGVLRGGLLARYEQASPEMCAAMDAVIAYADRFGQDGLSRAVRHGADSCTLRCGRAMCITTPWDGLTSTCTRGSRPIWKAAR